MDELLKKQEQRLADLQAGYQRMIADIHAQEGAIQECEHTIKAIREAMGTAKPAQAGKVVPLKPEGEAK